MSQTSSERNSSINQSRQLQIDDATLKRRATNKQIHILVKI